MEESLQLARILEHKDGIATSLANLGAVMLQQGMIYNPIKAKSYLIESEKLCQEVGNYEQLIYTQNSLGEFYLKTNDYKNLLS